MTAKSPDDWLKKEDFFLSKSTGFTMGKYTARWLIAAKVGKTANVSFSNQRSTKGICSTCNTPEHPLMWIKGRKPFHILDHFQ